LAKEFEAAQQAAETPEHYPVPMGVWQGFSGGPEPADDDPQTGVPKAQLQELLRRLAAVPEPFHLHKKLLRSVEARRQMAEGERPLDWSAAEALAFASLAVSGHRVRLSGQDSVRGTFSQRHALLHDVVDSRHHDPFANLAADQAPIEMINSPLSEAGVMGFDYGYSLDYPTALVLWEAQFGDFVNAAQVIIDQFLASAEDKWQRLSGLVLLLPHGFEGQGPEHSSARQERFMVLAAEDNLQLVSPTTPAQYFHCLRRQVLRRWRKPLVIFTPKSLLRDPEATSSLDELAQGRFERVLPDRRSHPASTERVLLCGGKLYYELANYREKHQRSDVAIVRVEQFYPLSDETLSAAIDGVSTETPVFWVQEEPLNMGAWPYWRLRYGDRLLGRYSLCPIARSPSSSPASGSKSVHRAEQQELLQRAFAEQP
jgi:2-oxoglutarate dehydrogenase E1 component